MSDFLIVGAGAIGLLQARELARAGASVTLLERGECGKEASWAGGGIVSPLYPWRYSAPVTTLAQWAQGFYPELSASLQDETGIDTELVQTGLLMLNTGDEAMAISWSESTGKCIQQVDPHFIYAKEPLLGLGFDHGLWMPGIANIRNPRLIRALAASLRQMPNVQVREGCQVVRFVEQGNRVHEVIVEDGGNLSAVRADKIIVAAGAWSGRVLAGCGVTLEVAPVKGQMLLYFDARPLISSIVLHEGRYLIPRKDGHILVGSTLEETGFDKSISDNALRSLQSSAVRMLPQLQKLEPVRQWSGLRPGSAEGIPFIGQVPGYENLFVNAGHFRNGLVLAPASARLLADLVLERRPIVDPAPYQLMPRIIRGPVSSDDNAAT